MANGDKMGLFPFEGFLREAEKLGSRGLIIARFLLHAEVSVLPRASEGLPRHRNRRIFRLFKRNRDMALGRQIVYFIGLRLPDNPDKTGRIRHVAMMNKKMNILRVYILQKMVYAAGIKKGRAPPYT